MTSRSKRFVQTEIFDGALGHAKRDAALDNHESGRGVVLRALRDHLAGIYRFRRDTLYRNSPDEAFVTADDAIHYLKKHPELKLAPGPWMGAIFKSPGWKHTGKWVTSVRATNNGRMNRCWRYDA